MYIYIYVYLCATNLGFYTTWFLCDLNPIKTPWSSNHWFDLRGKKDSEHWFSRSQQRHRARSASEVRTEMLSDEMIKTFDITYFLGMSIQLFRGQKRWPLTHPIQNYRTTEWSATVDRVSAGCWLPTTPTRAVQPTSPQKSTRLSFRTSPRNGWLQETLDG